MGRGGVDRASSSDARGPGFEPRPIHLKKIPLLYPKPSGSSELDVWSLSCMGVTPGSDKKKIHELVEIMLDSLSNSVLCFIHWCFLHERCYGCRCRSQHACSIVYPIKQTSSWANWFAIFFFRATRPTGWPLQQQQSVKPITLRSRTFPTKFTLLIFKNFHLTEKHCETVTKSWKLNLLLAILHECSKFHFRTIWP